MRALAAHTVGFHLRLEQRLVVVASQRGRFVMLKERPLPAAFLAAAYLHRNGLRLRDERGVVSASPHAPGEGLHHAAFGDFHPAVRGIHLCLQSPHIFNQMMDKQMGDKPGLSATKVANFLIPLPPIEEQQRIVDRLNTILPMCDALVEET